MTFRTLSQTAAVSAEAARILCTLIEEAAGAPTTARRGRPGHLGGHRRHGPGQRTRCGLRELPRSADVRPPSEGCSRARPPGCECCASLWNAHATAGSPGEVEGDGFAVHGPEDFASFPNGAILVARTTNPAWTALFYQATGVITESGGAVSHGAVTARELGLPAVMAVPEATSRFVSGERVRINGSAGLVSRI